jgi:hypothetical protein
MDLKTTRQVAQILKSTRSRLIADIGRYPQLKPVVQLPTRDYLWTDAEIERIKAHRASRKQGRPKKQS